MTREPAVTISTVSAVVAAAIGLAAAFGLDLTDEQRDAILYCVAPFTLLLLALGPVIRHRVVSPQTAANLAVMAKQDVEPTREVPAITGGAAGAYADAVQEMAYTVKPPPAN